MALAGRGHQIGQPALCAHRNLKSAASRREVERVEDGAERLTVGGVEREGAADEEGVAEELLVVERVAAEEGRVDSC